MQILMGSARLSSLNRGILMRGKIFLTEISKGKLGAACKGQ
jgi:hypothetical protein